MTLRVALAEDSILVREGLTQLLATQDDVTVVAACADLPSLRAAIEREQPDVVMTDIRMPPTESDEGIRIAEELRETHPGIGVVVLSQFSEPEYALALLDGGSDRRAYMLKERVHNRAELLSAVRTVAAGGSWIDPKVVEVLVASRDRSEQTPLSDLTDREREVLALVARGMSNAEVGQHMHVSPATAKTHVGRVLAKLHARDRAQLVVIAYETGLVRRGTPRG